MCIGEYGAHDVFLGIPSPELRKLVKETTETPSYGDLVVLLESKFNEERLLALFYMVKMFDQSQQSPHVQKDIVDFYVANFPHINNWNLVDSSAYHLLGAYLVSNPQELHVLQQYATHESLWVRRIAIVSTLAFIRHQRFEATLTIATLLLQDEEDLIHKAVGWMLREMGKQEDKMATSSSPSSLRTFLDTHAPHMPRVMLRYSIEKMGVEERKMYLAAKQKV
ncbi:DNA alkylation repair protein [archaeon]|nr:MAG: DNA alkylation repair protein [archaeon]